MLYQICIPRIHKCNNRFLSPNSPDSASTSDFVLEIATTWAPNSTNFCVSPFPMPFPAPVTIIFLPSKFNISKHFFLFIFSNFTWIRPRWAEKRQSGRRKVALEKNWWVIGLTWAERKKKWAKKKEWDFEREKKNGWQETKAWKWAKLDQVRSAWYAANKTS